MKIFFLILSIFIISCGQPIPAPPVQSLNNNWEQHTEFAEYIHGFIYDANRYGVDLNINNLHIKFNEIEKPVVGRCYPYSGVVLIEIDPVFWESAGVINQEILMYHELGHCILNRTHEIDAVSIMAPRLISSAVYLYYKEEYLEELFDVEKFDSLRIMSFLDDTVQKWIQ